MPQGIVPACRTGRHFRETSTPPTAAERAFDALRRRVWEASVSEFHRALQGSPGDPRLHLGLGRAYEGVSRDKDDPRPFLLLAIEQYRLALRSAPALEEAHDALLAVSTRADLLPDLLDEYKRRLADDPESAVHLALLKKIEALLLLRVSPAPNIAPPKKFSAFLLEWALPAAGLLCLVAALAFRIQTAVPRLRPISGPLAHSGVFLLVLFLGCKLLMKR